MKILFLDFDGVISTRRVRYDYFDPVCMELLKNLVEDADAHIVVTSSWRKRYDIETMKELFRINGDEYWMHYRSRRYLGAPREFPVDRIVGIVGQSSRGRDDGVPWGRGHEISMWLDTNSQHVDSYVVLDDETGDIEPHLDRLVQTSTEHGLTQVEVDKVKEMFKGS